MTPGLSKSQSLVHLDLQDNDLQGDEISGEALARLLKGSKALQTLILDGNSRLCAGKTCAFLMSAALPMAPSLKTLGMSSTGMTPEAAKALAPGLSGIKGGVLVEFDVSGNSELGDLGAAHLLSSIKNHKTMEKVNIGNIGIGKASTPLLLGLIGGGVGGGGKGAGGATKGGGTKSKGGGGILRSLTIGSNEDLSQETLATIEAWQAQRRRVLH